MGGCRLHRKGRAMFGAGTGGMGGVGWGNANPLTLGAMEIVRATSEQVECERTRALVAQSHRLAQSSAMANIPASQSRRRRDNACPSSGVIRSVSRAMR